ncbi:MYOSIN-2 HEAVY CHAIN-LIKE PROTEIN [Salix koriyanagi]|uniref:MYOSIN-2 HEAVY CHAIN-LIKE PROTEIN n=1 Tax=Salix koriyanagi TaxID=2511006 RepID=A0A9Q0TRR1_9ROSI|nr:MYOSIN-2 HEAVY CHAIN-LIKE PROTEIN [Salix koriyanagi]
MDTGCLDLGCTTMLDKHGSDSFALDPVNKECNSREKVSSGSKIGKNKSPKGTGQSALNALSKFTSQIKKPAHRKNSPINWFPRKKGDSYLQRKIKMLQELDGMNMTLDEALGDSNPHYSRVLREKIEAGEAANKAVEARKAALVEASWCRILKAARIQSKEAEELLLEADKNAAEAAKASKAMEVIMFDMPNSPRMPCLSTVNVGGSTAHMATASFATVFEVDKQVAAAVKTAFTRLANCPTLNKEEFKDLLRKISQNPGNDDSNSEFSECESESGSEFELISKDMDCKFPSPGTRISKYKRRLSLDKFDVIKLVDVMLERLRCLNEDELSSLATIVATCGLNAALAEVENSKVHHPVFAADYTSSQALNLPRRMSSSVGSGKMNEVPSGLPSLGKFLVKHMSKLEREVQEAKDRRRNELKAGNQGNVDCKKTSSESTPDLGSILMKHSSKLEKEIEEAKKHSRKSFENISKKQASDLTTSVGISDLGSILIEHPSKLEKGVLEIRKNSGKTFDMDGKDPGGEINGQRKDVPEVPSLDKFLVKHVSRLEKEVQEAKNRRQNESVEKGRLEKENVDLNKEDNLLEREQMPELSSGGNCGNYRHQNKHGGTVTAGGEGLDKVLVKRVSRLEKEKMSSSLNQEDMNLKRIGRKVLTQSNEGGLDQILVKQKSRLEREKMVSAQQSGEEVPARLSVSRREARERELQAAWGGLSLGNSIRPHLSKLEKEKAAWIKAEEEARRQATGV